MKVEKSLKLAHTSSVLISVILNALLVVGLFTFITLSSGMERDTTTVMVIDPVNQEDIEELEEEIVEEVQEPDDLDELVDFTLDTPMDTQFEQETEAVADVTNTDVSSLSDLMSDVSSPVVMTGLLVGRTPRARQAAAARYGRGLEKFSEPAVMKSLEWLRDHQAADGSWNKQGTKSRGNVGYTGLALLAFLAHGETPASLEFGDTVSRGLRFLVENQDSKGVFRPAGGHTVYGHAMATYAMAEAYTMTDTILLREPLQRGVKVIMDGQMENGGYDYEYKKENRNDVSVGAWHVQALKASSIALHDDPEVKKYFQHAMDGMVFGSSVNSDGARSFAYTVNNAGKLGNGNHPILSSAGTLGLYLSGRSKSKEARQALKYIERFTNSDLLPQWGNLKSAGSSTYGGEIMLWYYTVQAFFQENPDGKNFTRYMASMVKALAQNQAEDGHWDCYTENGKKQGPVFNTSLAALGLMVYYRYLPTTQADNIKPAEATFDVDEDDGDIGFEI
ncbi:terpene cyclase/mutase family protein [Kiritimatiellota bacterium B12222]|nr:terpene cyclase/mutase family protein [Kiritimatiellota bacterium B12222]